MSDRGPLGIVDWGIGGLDLYRKLRAAGSTRDVLYWSDAGAPPYGTLDQGALASRLGSVLQRLDAAGCPEVVVACNAASTVLLLAIPLGGSVRVTGVIRPTVSAIEQLGLTEVALIGGRRTVESKAYATPLRDKGCRVTARVAQPLSALIERGITEGPELEACLEPILAPLHDAEHLVLACTHYVAARSAIERRLPRLRTVLDPAAETLRWMAARWDLDGGHSEARFVTTGDPGAMRESAARAFGVELPRVDSVPLDD